MKTVVLFITAFLVVVTAAGQTVVNGRVTGENGVPLRAAAVALCQPPDFIPVKSVIAEKDGGYSMTIETPGIWMLRFNGVLYRSHLVALYCPGRQQIDLDVELGTYDYVDNFDAVKVKGTFNNWSILTSVPMQKQADGTYTADIPTVDSIQYQLMYVRKGNAIEGTDADRYVPDQTGNYRAMIASKDGKAHIKFEPRMLGLPGTPAKVVFGGTGSVASEFAGIYDEFQAEKEKYGEAFQNHIRSRKGLQNFNYDRSLIETAITKRLKTESDSILRQELLVNALSMAVIDKKADTSLYQKILKEVPPSSIVWLLDPHAIFQALNRGGYSKDKRDVYVRRVMDENPAPRVVSALLFDEYHIAKYSGLDSKAARYYEYVVSRFPDSPEAVQLRKSFPHEIDIMVGRPVPDFSVISSADSARVLTKKSFAGSYLLLDFWSSRGKNFATERKILESIYKKYRKKNFQILSLSLDSTSKAGHARMNAPWPNTWLGNNPENEIVLKFQVAMVPTLFLVDPGGKLLAMGDDLRGDKLEPTLKKYLEGR